ncbi:30S ribosomal protein S17 [Patescibacteria group bacterium]|nr:30S ribosomal protein S17 [Patescibacteria group bacterium]MBU0879303.1 30S ribosomal protein S17 [Patescibacteria group bacterium]MBU0880253.1 30S ribosomal protein S17 [Patescibacteria group bacterium]MBU0898132.1 30S ribosomal protein S17 [Patescibacteria group bacterium]MBU1062662.1 30S ribosomal protein S17 [Patescibacteria group bacterium]
MDSEKKVIKRVFNGVVASDKMDKTIVVLVSRVKIHPRYKKRYTVSKKYKVHDEKNQYKEGDKVSFVETRPISKDKKWKVLVS